jgi:transcriptional regulator with XRE-family HTH domain
VRTLGRDGFGALLQSFMSKAGLSQNALARKAGCDTALVNRMVNKDIPPSRGIVLSMAGVLGLTPSQRDRLLFAAGHAPEIDYQEAYVRLRSAIIDTLSATHPITEQPKESPWTRQERTVRSS